MAKNCVQCGDVLLLAVAGGCESGDPVAVGEFKGVALEAIADGESGEVALTGVWSFPKTASAVTAGDKAYFTAAGNVTASDSGNTELGVFAASATAGDDEALVRLPG